MLNAYGSFRYGMFVVNHRVSLAAVTVDFFMVRTISDWFEFLDVTDIWVISADQVVVLRQMHSEVHPHLNVCLALLFELVYYCSNAYRNDVSIETLLHRQVYPNRETQQSGLSLTNEDANVLCGFLSSKYKVDHLADDSGFLLLERAVRYVKSLLSLRIVVCSGCVFWLVCFHQTLQKSSA